jgi:hypothetical protein
MGNSVSEHNNRTLATVRRSDIELPSVIAVWRHSREALRGGNESAALFRCEPDGWHQGAWRITFVSDPLEHIEDGNVVRSNEDEWLGGQMHRILIKRVSSDPKENAKYNDTEIQYMGYKIVSNVGGPSIPVVNFNRKSEVLPSVFTQLDTPAYAHLRFKLRVGRLINPFTYRILQRDPVLMAASEYVRGEFNPPAVRAVPIQPVQQKIPQRIINVYIDSLIAAKETCPIELTELTRENVCMPPCGHAMTCDAAAAWLRTSRSCPVCRAALSSDDLVRWA